MWVSFDDGIAVAPPPTGAALPVSARLKKANLKRWHIAYQPDTDSASQP
jgi:hypothetical protein